MNCSDDPYASALIALKNGDSTAQDDAIETLGKLVMPVARRTAHRFGGFFLDPEDLGQAINISLLRLAESYQYDPERPAVNLIVHVAYRAAFGAARSLGRQRPRGVLSLDLDVFRNGQGQGPFPLCDILEDLDTPTPDDASADADEARVARAIFNDELSELERNVWVARHVNGMSYDEIAAVLSAGREKPVTFRSVDNSLRRAERKFARLQRVRRIRDDECRM